MRTTIAALLLAGCASQQATGPNTGATAGTASGDDERSGAGALTPEQMEAVQNTVQRGMPAINRCYEEELERRGDKRLQGRVMVKIQIGTDQSAAAIEIGADSLPAPAMHQCIRQVIQGWEFPAIPVAAWFTYPFQFSPAY